MPDDEPQDGKPPQVSDTELVRQIQMLIDDAEARGLDELAQKLRAALHALEERLSDDLQNRH